MNGAIGVLRKTRVVRDHADRRAARVQFLQQIHDGFAVARIEVAGRFVGQEDGRFAGERARDRDALLLTAGELARQMFGAMPHADALERFVDESFAFARAHAAIGQRQLDVFVNGQVADEIEALENEADFAIANAGTFRKGEVRDLAALQRVAPVRRRVEQTEDREQGRFSAAGRAGDGDVFAGANVEVNARERVRFDFVGQEDLGDAVEVNEGVVPLFIMVWLGGEVVVKFVRRVDEWDVHC